MVTKISLPLPTVDLDSSIFDFSPEPPPDPVNKKLAAIAKMPKEDIPDLLEWTLAKRKMLGPNRPFNLDKHLYLAEIYQSKAKEIILMKASQMGASEWLIGYAAHACDQRLANVIYIFPTETHVSDFSTARLGPAIEASDYLNKIIVDGASSGGLRGSDKIALKRLRDRFWYFRGGKVQPDGKAPQLKSVDADILIFDEVDEIDPRAIEIGRKRLGHAREDLGNVLFVSTPTYPGTGIHEQFLDTDQRRWFIRCVHCGERQHLEIDSVVFEWDDLGRPSDWHGREENRAWAACRGCGRELNRLGDGEWVAEFPENERAGYHLTKLFSAQNKLLTIVKNLDTVDQDKLREAYNQDLGLPFSPRGGSLDSGRLDACRREYGHGPDFFHTSYMGVDVGTKTLHVVIRTLPDRTSGETRQLYAGEVTWEHLPNIVKIYRPKIVVIDAMPETTKAREFQNDYPRNMVWLSYYPQLPHGSKKEDNFTLNPKDRTILLDRTRIMDETFAGFYGMTSTLPANARNIRDYYKQMMTSIRTTVEDANHQLVARFIEVGSDHYLHAEVFCLAASKIKYGQGWTEGQGA